MFVSSFGLGFVNYFELSKFHVCKDKHVPNINECNEADHNRLVGFQIAMVVISMVFFVTNIAILISVRQKINLTLKNSIPQSDEKAVDENWIEKTTKF